jgi:flagellar capping protein FliD
MYLYVYTDNFGFKDPKINEILEDDIEISEDIYNKFFKEQAKGKQFEIKNITGETFEEIFQEVIPEPMEATPVEPNPIEKLQQENAELQKQMEKQNERLDEQNKAMAEMMNLIAMQGITP